MEISDDDWKVVEARLQYDIDNNLGGDMYFGFIGEPTLSTGNSKEVKHGN